uniref:Reverse transcriptase zinc-binding domain-containing protein n=1 Tax=Fagus sylvatica TaxID=28930 RepID=A0A2N9GSU5_FAGSY
MERKLAGWQHIYGKEEDALWRQVICSRYGSSHGGWTTREVAGPHGFSLWKLIRKEWGTFAWHVHFEVGDGSKTKFWTDFWCGTCSLKEAYPGLFRIARNKEAFDWELESIASFLELLYSSSAKGHGVDVMCWNGSSKEGFQVKSYYRALLVRAGRCVPWKSIWKTKAPPRVAFFIWAAALGCILTTNNLRRRHVIVLDWCCMWCRSARIRKLWDMIPLCVFCCLWWERNSRSFEGEETNLLEIKGTFLRTLIEWSNASDVMSFSSVLDFLDFCIA